MVENAASAANFHPTVHRAGRLPREPSARPVTLDRAP
jgi:hypothetical protein